jgi:predicted dehydrogenase
LDFNLWLGPAPQQAYHANLVHYNWHWFWDFGNGDIGNQGIHEMDVARWAIKGATLPSRVCQELESRFGEGGRTWTR